jgi:diadenosine tetraphosphate (Ap4A) HIT family hydrolase
MKPAEGSGTCRICDGLWPVPDHRIGDCGRTTAYLHEDQFFPGWTVLVFKRHATELFQLTREERSEVIEEVNRMAMALAAEFNPVKVNYGLLGNQLPHIHWHVVPRLADDPAPLEAIWGVRHEPVHLSSGELRQRISRIQRRLTASV